MAFNINIIQKLEIPVFIVHLYEVFLSPFPTKCKTSQLQYHDAVWYTYIVTRYSIHIEYILPIHNCFTWQKMNWQLFLIISIATSKICICFMFQSWRFAGFLKVTGNFFFFFSFWQIVRQIKTQILVMSPYHSFDILYNKRHTHPLKDLGGAGLQTLWPVWPVGSGTMKRALKPGASALLVAMTLRNESWAQRSNQWVLWTL